MTRTAGRPVKRVLEGVCALGSGLLLSILPALLLNQLFQKTQVRRIGLQCSLLDSPRQLDDRSIDRCLHPHAPRFFDDMPVQAVGLA